MISKTNFMTIANSITELYKKAWIQYMFCSMGLKAINPAIANSITELLFLPV